MPQLKSVQKLTLAELHANIPEMGTVTIRTNQADLNSKQVYYSTNNVKPSNNTSKLMAIRWSLKLPT